MKTPCIAILVLFWKAQFSIEKFIKCLISYWIEYNSSDLEPWEINCVFFEFISHNESDFELKSFQYVSFHTIFQPRFRFWFEHFTTCQISNQLSKHASHFESNILKRIRFWIEKNFKPLCFELKIFRHVRFLKNCVHSKYNVMVHFNPRKRHVLLLCCFQKHKFELKKMLRVLCRMKRIQLVRLPNMRITSRLFLSLKTTKRQISS